MSNLELIKEKHDRLTELNLELLNCVKQTINTVNKPWSKYNKVNLNRCYRAMGWAMKAKMIKNQIDMVKAQPIPPYKGGEVIQINSKQ